MSEPEEETCPDCGSVIRDDDLEEGVCPHCNAELFEEEE